MDPRYPSHQFPRPQPQQQVQEQRYGPITPSPFASQPPAPRPETLHKNDPFLRWRNDLEEPRQSPSINNAPNSYMLPQASRYSSNSTSIPHGAPSSDAHLRRSSFGGAGLWVDGRGDRLAIHTSEGERILFLSRFWGQPRSLKALFHVSGVCSSLSHMRNQIFFSSQAARLASSIRSRKRGIPSLVAAVMDVEFGWLCSRQLLHVLGTCAVRRLRRMMMWMIAPLFTHAPKPLLFTAAADYAYPVHPAICIILQSHP